jgi:hypothetical protein
MSSLPKKLGRRAEKVGRSLAKAAELSLRVDPLPIRRSKRIRQTLEREAAPMNLGNPAKKINKMPLKENVLAFPSLADKS